VRTKREAKSCEFTPIEQLHTLRRTVRTHSAVNSFYEMQDTVYYYSKLPMRDNETDDNASSSTTTRTEDRRRSASAKSEAISRFPIFVSPDVTSGHESSANYISIVVETLDFYSGTSLATGIVWILSLYWTVCTGCTSRMPPKILVTICRACIVLPRRQQSLVS
jgi:hypothetical protein